MSNIVYADTVGIDGTVYPTTGENIRNSNLLIRPKEIISVKFILKQNEKIISSNDKISTNKSGAWINGRDLFLIQILDKSINGNTNNFLQRVLVNNKLGLLFKESDTLIVTGEITLLLGVI